MDEYLEKRLDLEKKLKQKKLIKKSFFSKIKNYILKSNLFYYFYNNSKNDIIINEQNLYFNNLPKSFNGFRILFISDLHLEVLPNNIDKLKKLKIPDADILILGGDIFDNPSLNNKKIDLLNDFLNIFKIKQKFCILGNHDSISFLDYNLNLKFLINEKFILNKNEEFLNLIGIDDYTLFKTEEQFNLLKNQNKNQFNILLSHNPDVLLDLSLEEHFSLQLSGHTHGGQIKLPFNFILYPHTKYKKCIKGLWKSKKLQGFTSSGYGCSGLPLRNIKPEICLLTLNNTK